MEITVKFSGQYPKYQFEVSEAFVRIGLSEHGSAGYLWDVVGDLPHTAERRYDKNAPPGSGGTVWFKINLADCSSFKLEHKRPWVPEDVLDWVKVDCERRAS